jgi:hypothetical protein
MSHWDYEQVEHQIAHGCTWDLLRAASLERIRQVDFPDGTFAPKHQPFSRLSRCFFFRQVLKRTEAPSCPRAAVSISDK